MKRLLATILLSVILLAGTACAPKQELYQTQYYQLFDTVTIIMGYGDSREAFVERADLVRDDLETYHKLYDIYQSAPGITNLHDVNRLAGEGPVEVDSRILDMLQVGVDAYESTGGKINIAMGSVLGIWHKYRMAGIDDPDSAALPDPAELKAAAEHTDIRDLVIDHEAGTVEFLDPELRLDVGAIAKGYATEQVARLAIERGEEQLLISCGGNVRAIGARTADGEPWRVGIEKPIKRDDDESPNVTRTGLIDTSLVTSGLYGRYYTVDGTRYHHIIDPVTLFPEDRFLSVSILTADSGQADMLSTVLFNSSLEEGRALIESLPDTEALWILMDESIIRSSGFSDHELAD